MKLEDFKSQYSAFEVLCVIAKMKKIVLAAFCCGALLPFLYDSLYSKVRWISVISLELSDGTPMLDYDAPAIAINSMSISDARASFFVRRTSERGEYRLEITAPAPLTENDLLSIFETIKGRVNNSRLRLLERSFSLPSCPLPTITISQNYQLNAFNQLRKKDSTLVSLLVGMYFVLFSFMLLVFRKFRQ